MQNAQRVQYMRMSGAENITTSADEKIREILDEEQEYAAGAASMAVQRICTQTCAGKVRTDRDYQCLGAGV